MKNQVLFYLTFLFIISGVFPQDAVHNYGNIQLHETAMVGFHTNLINDGVFDENLGVVGFYNSENPLYVSGAFRPIFYDAEIAVEDNLFLEVGIGVRNNSNFIFGNVITPRNMLDVNLEYIDDAFYTGEIDATKVDGYSALRNKQNFSFPIGISEKLRPLELFSDTVNQNAKSAYFYEDPNNPTTFSTSFNTETRTDILTAVSTYEFWDIDAITSSSVKIAWDDDSNIENFVDAIENIRVVGWHTSNEVWEDLGGIKIAGDFNSGNVTSENFVPDDYSVVTFGSSLSRDNISLDNYMLTPNGDGINDFLFIDAVALSPNNKLEIYNRWGRLVYEEKDYANLFDGKANVSFTISANKKLPDGVYFYIIELFDINLRHQGYLHIGN